MRWDSKLDPIRCGGDSLPGGFSSRTRRKMVRMIKIPIYYEILLKCPDLPLAIANARGAAGAALAREYVPGATRTTTSALSARGSAKKKPLLGPCATTASSCTTPDASTSGFGGGTTGAPYVRENARTTPPTSPRCPPGRPPPTPPAGRGRYTRGRPDRG